MEPQSHLVEDSTPPQINHVDDAVWARQLALEEEMHQLGVVRYRNALKHRLDRGLESETTYGQDLMAGCINLVSKGITDWKARVDGTRAASRGIALKYLRDFDDTTAAFIGLKVVLDSISLQRSLLSSALQVGGMIEDEVRFQKFEAAEPPLFKKIQTELLLKEPSYKRKAITMKVRMRHYQVEWQEWPHDHKLHLGMKVLDIIIQSTDIVTIGGKGIMEGANRRGALYLSPTHNLISWIRNHTNFWEVLTPVLLPCLIKPRPFEDVWEGGYWTHKLKPLRLFKKRSKQYLNSLSTSCDLTRVLTAVNTLQDTGWQVNRQVLAVAQECWDRGMTRPGLPQRDHDELPAKPHDIETNPVALRAWKTAAATVYRANAKRAGQTIQTAKILWLAEKFKDEQQFYFPYQLDFRGRAYAVPMFLQPQGHDLARGLIRFSEGKPLGDEGAAYWLAIHGANLYGYDKVSLEDRVIWAQDHTPQILACAADPLNNTFWMDADGSDKAWQFLAFCFEWAGYQRDGLAHVTHLPIALDGSCNGLQHFSAMLRDPVGGAATNLVPADVPQDIYSEVAKVVMEALRADTEAPYAARWVQFGITRKITKRPVMVLPYGGTKRACDTYTLESIKELIQHGAENPFGDELPKAVRYLSGVIWSSIGKVVVAAVGAMGWLRKIAQAHNKAKLPIVWETPIGLKIVQDYKKMRVATIKLRLLGTPSLFQRRIEADNIDPKRQSLGMSPNFVHSMDAAAMMLCVLSCREQGMTSFAMIHDSYGTLAPDTYALANTLRDEFVKMYREHDPISSLYIDTLERTKIDVPKPPMGDLKLHLTLESRFFFA